MQLLVFSLSIHASLTSDHTRCAKNAQNVAYVHACTHVRTLFIMHTHILYRHTHTYAHAHSIYVCTHVHTHFMHACMHMCIEMILAI